MPPGSLGLQLFQRMGHVALRGASHGKFHDEHGKAHKNQEKQIDHKKNSAAIFTGDVGETPYVAKADGTTGGKEQEPQSAGELFTLTHNSFS